ncbi:hypothetical protein HanXRQr2_Chr15g0677071 [Helianthus annuus]|uniref:Uncharacterized protein n=1 Tax=Helianthus annuus TaxID=4232 RepID=A0A251S6C5_HELAN|nr:hypothetical protein HanXRQr2_Chr15g0677071 [Helianthus annuus]
MSSVFSELEIPNGSLTEYINKAFEKLTVDKGMPPVLDSWRVAYDFLKVGCISSTGESVILA